MRHTKAQIEQSLSRAVAAQTPDVLPHVLRRLEEQKGLEENMQTITLPQAQQGPQAPAADKKPKRRAVRWAAALAAAAAIAFGIWAGAAFYRTDAIISLDVNPSIELRVNSAEKVLAATARNAEAETILGEMDLRNVDLDVAMNALIGSMLKHGFITDARNTVLISVENGDARRGAALQEKLASEVGGLLSASAVDGAVLSQTLTEDDNLRALASQYNISLGKAALVDLLVSQDPLLTFAEIAPLPVNDIYLLLAARQTALPGVAASGNPSSNAYIGEAKAQEIALAHAGVARQDAMALKTKLDYEDGRMVYEVEFKTAAAEFEYDIDAVSGDVLKAERDEEDGYHSGGSALPANALSEADAKAIALAHAGVGAGQANFVKSTWYEKQGVYRYDFVFLTASHKYSYEVNAVTGEVIANYAHSLSGGSGGSTGGTGSYIGEAQAKASAFTHAGVEEAAVYKLEVELKEDDGRMIYDIEFKAGGMEYDYEIDAYTGAVLEWESEPD